MGIGWRTKNHGAENLKGRHRNATQSGNPVIPDRSPTSLEPETEFDWEAVEDRAGVVMEWMLAEKMPVTRPQAEGILRFIATMGAESGVYESSAVLRLRDWLGSDSRLMRPAAKYGGGPCPPEAKVTNLRLRAMIFLREMSPGTVLAAMSLKDIAAAEGVSAPRLVALANSLWEAMRK